jgi:hypothetical protein
MIRALISRVIMSIVAIVLLGGEADAQARRGLRAPGVAGTYAVTICRVSCDPARGGEVLTRGHVVLEASTFRLTSLPDAAERYFRTVTALLALAEGEGDPNACFALTQPTSLDVNAGQEPVGVTRWRKTSGDTIRLELERGSHSSYAARFVVRGARLRGVGQSEWQSEDAPVDVLEGQRIGPPDRSLCLRAAERRLREIGR